MKNTESNKIKAKTPGDLEKEFTSKPSTWDFPEDDYAQRTFIKESPTNEKKKVLRMIPF